MRLVRKSGYSRRRVFQAISLKKGHFERWLKKTLKSKTIQVCLITRVHNSLEVHNVLFGMTVLFRGHNILCRAAPISSSKLQKSDSATPAPLTVAGSGVDNPCVRMLSILSCLSQLGAGFSLLLWLCTITPNSMSRGTATTATDLMVMLVKWTK